MALSAGLVGASLCVGAILAVLLLLRHRHARIRAVGGLLALPVALFFLLVVISTLRYGITVHGGWPNEPRQRGLECGIIGGLFVSSGVAIWWHRRVIRRGSVPAA